MNPSEVWRNYWLSKKINNSRLSDRLGTYQIPAYLFLKDKIKKNNIKSILNAGCGQDIISLNLQRYFKNKLQISLLDISKEVLEWNKKLFEKCSLKADFVDGDIFAIHFKDNVFDLVFNTGVLEHFEKEEQIKITKEILRVLKPSGYFITANPSDKGWIYKFGMMSAKKKGIWPFGKENPINGLKFLKNEILDIESIEEFDKDFLSQLGFLSYINPLWKFITLPIYFLTRLLYKFQSILQLCDSLFSKIFGTYLIISVIKKK